MPRYDLHCHSTSSDGLLSPAAVVARAASRGVDVLALTDHDDISGLAEASRAAVDAGIGFVPGSELSVNWEDLTVHVVALGIDPGDRTLTAGLRSIREGRTGRAKRIGESLAAAGIPGAYQGALAFVTSEELVSRTHFARWLVETGRCRDIGDVFKRYLVPGRPGYVEHEWTTLPQAIGWIHGAGGVAVLAHPGRYKVGGERRMTQLIDEFTAAGGDALEVLSPSHSAAQVAQFATHARLRGLAASTGSDYHGPGESWLDLGDLPPLPAGLEPVWSRF
ncbi:MAG: PHP domain-containing protein [Burkholderiales bacterium]|nr:PHP domain-containing protein [Burkholderiales bacterium]MCE7876958.1 PHP domain-containing protein [Betaproteobacteria bacterium PRO3]